MSEFSPVLLSVIQNGLSHIVDEMDLATERSAFNPAMSELRDRASGIYSVDGGAVIAQGETGLPIFIGVMKFAVAAAVEAFPELAPGDIVALNDPYLGGTHLMDTKLVKPFFYRGKLFCYLANTGHWVDVGGSVPGGFNSKATEIFQEGLRIPPIRLFREGKLDRDLLELILTNMRLPEERMGDLQAQLAGINVGERRLTEFLDKYGADTVSAYIGELSRRSEKQMRSAIERLPDGRYSFEAKINSDGIVWKPINLALDLTIDGDELVFDFSRSDAPVAGPLNCSFPATAAAVYLSIKHIFPDIPINDGCFRPVRIVAPETTFLNARYPKAVSGSSAEVSMRICDVVFGCLAQAAPDLVPAASFGTVSNFTIGGFDPVRGKRYIMFRFSGGGYGGHPISDGLTNGCGAISMARTSSIEVQEQLYPVRFEYYRMKQGSAGAGKNRGGFGTEYLVRLTAGEGVGSVMGDRGVFGPYGLHDGHEGGKAEVEFHRDGERFVPRHITKEEVIPLKAGDAVRIASPGGGGWGNPLERDVEAVRKDVERELLGADEARTIYGVVLDRNEQGRLVVDADATSAERAGSDAR